MTFTFSPSLATDADLVRFHIGDTSDDGHYVEDESIAYFLSILTVEETVIACIRYIITQLSSPNFKQDWLSVDLDKAREGYERLLKEKAKELGVSLGTVASASISLPRRADSYEEAGRVVDGAP